MEFLDKQTTPGFKRSAARAKNCSPCFHGGYLTKIAKECFGGQDNRETHVGGWTGQEEEGNNEEQTESNMGHTQGNVKARMGALAKQN